MTFFKLKKPAFLLAMALASSIALSACSSSSSSSGDVLKVGLDDNYPPLEFKDSDGKTTIGFDADIAKELAKRLGKKDVQFVSNDFAGVFDALETKKFDVVISGVSVNEDRQKNHSMTEPYIANKVVIVTKEGDTSIKGPEDFKGKKIGAQVGTTSDEFVSRLVKENKVESDNFKTYPIIIQPFEDLALGRIDAVVVDIVVAKYYINNNQGKYKVIWESPEAEPMAMVFRKDDTETRDKANQIIKDMQEDGTMKEISEKWFGDDITKNIK